MADDIGSVRGITGVSTSLNNQSGAGGQKPAASSSSSADKHCKPPRVENGKVPMPK
jgi:hypothetical protein